MSIWNPPELSIAGGYQAVGEAPTVQLESEPPNDYELEQLGIQVDGHNLIPNIDGLLVPTAAGQYVHRTLTIVTPVATVEVEVTQVGTEDEVLTVADSVIAEIVEDTSSSVTVESEPDVASVTGSTGAVSETTTTATSESITVEATPSAGALVSDEPPPIPATTATGATSTSPSDSLGGGTGSDTSIPATTVQTPTSTTTVVDSTQTTTSLDEALFDLLEQGLI